MESRINSLLLLLLCLVAPAAVSAEPLSCSKNSSNSHLWRINATTPVYLYGTLHVPYIQLWNSIPDNVKVAFASSTDYHMELDTSQPEVMDKVQQMRLLPEGQTLKGTISSELYSQVEGYIHRLKPLLRRWIQREAGLFAGLYVDQMMYSILGEWQRMRPVWVLNLLNSLTEEQVVGGGSRPLLDTFLRQAAEGLGKQVHNIESVEDQMEPLNRLSLPEVEFAMGIQLTVLEKYVFAGKPIPQVGGDVLTEYVCGNFSSLVESEDVLISSISKQNMTEEQLEQAAALQANVMRLLRYQRNKKIARRVAELTQTEDESGKSVHFVAVGAGHLVGERSVLEYLRSFGFDVQQISYLEEVDGPAIPDIVAMGDPPPEIMDLTGLKDLFEDDDDDDTFTIDPSVFLTTVSPTTWMYPTTQSIIPTTPTPPHPAPEEPTDSTNEEDSDHSSDVKVSGLVHTTSQSEPAELQSADSSAAMATYHSGVLAILCALALHALTHLL